MLNIIKDFFYGVFGKLLAKIFGLETYANIESIEVLKYVPVAWRLRPHYISVSFWVNGEIIYTAGIASNIDFLDAKKLVKGNKIRIKYLKNNPYIIYISEFKYVFQEADF